jgi:hypothetical protein
MARGWESKSAEEQAQQHADNREADAARTIQPQAAGRMRARQLLELKRERILSEKTSSAIRREALQAALAEIERELASLI